MFIPTKGSSEGWIAIVNATKCVLGHPADPCGFVWTKVVVFIIVGTLWVSSTIASLTMSSYLSSD